jgi:hypothetical protein
MHKDPVISKGNPLPVLRKLFLFSTFLLLCFSLLAQSKDDKKILDVFQKEIDCWNKGDIDCYVLLYAPDDSTRMLLKQNDIYGRDSIKAFYKKYWPKEKMGKLSFENVKIERLSKKYYYVEGNFIVSYPDKKPVSGRFSGLMKKIGKEWFIYTDHSG